MRRVARLGTFVLAATCGATLPFAAAQALTITVDYTYDSYFSTNLTARYALEAAAADLSAAVTTSLTPLTTDLFVGNSGATTATFDASVGFNNPSTGVATTWETLRTNADEVKLFVGWRPLPGVTVGVGGPAGAGAAIGVSGNPAQFAAAVGNAAANTQTALMRGGGPQIGTFDGYVGDTYFSVNYGVSYGALAFDNDTNNDSAIDSAAQLNAFWHFDHTTSVVAGKTDLYSVALHEMLHAIGLGGSASWDAYVSGTTWTGPHVIALVGSGVGLLAPDGDHIASSTMSTRISDGGVQEAVMDPSLTTGTRKYLTALDLAFLRDIGHTTITPTIPGDFNNNGVVNGADLTVWKTWFGINANADANNDGKSDGADFLIWQRNRSAAATATIAAVPEPTGVLLVLTAGVLVAVRAAGAGAIRPASGSRER